jgi:hypothetical protein
MLAIPYLFLSVLAALAIVQHFFREFPAIVRIVGAFLISIVVTSWVNFLAAWLIHSFGSEDATFYGGLVATLVNAVIIIAGRRQLWHGSFRVQPLEIVGSGATFALSLWIMEQRLSGNPLKVSANTWGDTALHIGIARSFSEGDNYPPVLPLFSGEPIRYHFGFDFYAGALERMGLPIEWAFNLPGALGFTAIMILISATSYYLWQRASIGVVAAILFVTSSTLAFLRYFNKYPSLASALQPHSWWNLNKYLAIGPYQANEQISIFFTLNPYLTQTHLIISIAIALFISYALLRHLRGPGGITGDHVDTFADENCPQLLTWRRAVALGMLSGASFWLNGIIFLVSMVFLAVLFYVYSGRLRRVALPSTVLVIVSVSIFVIGEAEVSNGIREIAVALLLGSLVLLGPIRQSLPFFAPAGMIALPQMLWLNGTDLTKSAVVFHDGWLVKDFRFDNIGSYGDFVTYWWLNLGLIGPLVILAAIVGHNTDRKLLAAVMAIFVFGNLIVLGTDVGGHGHKTFNLWETLVNLFAAYGLVWVWHMFWNGLPAIRSRMSLIMGRVIAVGLVPAACVALVLSGFFNFMTLKNDPRYEVFGDSQPAISWIEQNTARNAVFLTAYGDVYTTPTLAGRSVYLGGFDIWVPDMGYDNVTRQKTITGIYQAPNLAVACQRLRGTGVDYIQVGNSELQSGRFRLTTSLFPGEFVRVYSDNHVSYYDVDASCDKRQSPPQKGF